MTRRESPDGGRIVVVGNTRSIDTHDTEQPRRRAVSPGVTSSAIPANRRNRADATGSGNVPGGV